MFGGGLASRIGHPGHCSDQAERPQRAIEPDPLHDHAGAFAPPKRATALAGADA